MGYGAPSTLAHRINRMDILILLAALLGGFAALAWSADWFVAGASSAATRLGVSAMVIGLTVIGIGTSLPEMLVSAIAAIEGTPAIALGNALGSNIANVGLILGITALATPFAIDAGILRREYPVLMLVVAGTGMLLIDAEVSRLDGLLLIAGMLGVLIWLAREARRDDAHAETLQCEIGQARPPAMTRPRTALAITVGLIVLLASSRLLVWSASELARLIGVSELVIGLSVVAVGTSLPELAAATASVRRNEPGLVIGNILGSNIFNLLAVLGIAGILAPFAADGASLLRDYGIMTAFMLALIVAGFGLGQRGHAGRLEGSLLLAGFIGYQTLLFIAGR